MKNKQKKKKNNERDTAGTPAGQRCAAAGAGAAAGHGSYTLRNAKGKFHAHNFARTTRCCTHHAWFGELSATSPWLCSTFVAVRKGSSMFGTMAGALFGDVTGN